LSGDEAGGRLRRNAARLELEGRRVMLPFEGRNVVVTGGTGNLGGAIVQMIVGLGGRCFVPGHHAAAAPKVSGPGSVEVVAGVDLTDEASVERFYAGIPPCWASIQTAGSFAMSPIATTTKADFLKQFGSNAVTAFLCCREAVKKIRAAGGGGRLVNVSSKVTLHPVGGMIPYSMSKAAVNALTQSLAVELAPEQICVNAVLPSVMDTPANRASWPPGTDYSKWPKVQEVASTAVFLASPENKVTSGALVPVYGRS